MATAARKNPSTQPKPAKKPNKPASTKKSAKATGSDAAAPAPAKDTQPKAPAKIKRVRGTFSMPKADYERIAKLKLAAKRNGTKAKKNELLRLGLQALQQLTGTELNDRILALRVPGKPGRK